MKTNFSSSHCLRQLIGLLFSSLPLRVICIVFFLGVKNAKSTIVRRGEFIKTKSQFLRNERIRRSVAACRDNKKISVKDSKRTSTHGLFSLCIPLSESQSDRFISAVFILVSSHEALDHPASFHLDANPKSFG